MNSIKLAIFSDLTFKVVAMAKDITSNNTQLASLKSQLDELCKETSTVESEEGVLIDTTSSLMH